MNKQQKDFYEQMLANYVCKITINDNLWPNYTKVVRCTTKEDYVRQCGINHYQPINNDTCIRVVNIDSMSWMLLDLTTIKQFAIDSTGISVSMKDLPTEPSRAAKSQYAGIMPDKKEMDIQPTMTITHTLNKDKKNNISARQRWLIKNLELHACEITYINESGYKCKVTGTREPWVLIIAPYEPILSTDPDFINFLNLENGKWNTIPFSKIVLFETPTDTYIPKKQKVEPVSFKGVPLKSIFPPKPIEAKTDYYIQQLKQGICTIQFEKADGSLRVMNCSLDPKVIVALNLVPKTVADTISPDNDLIKVVDIDKEDWRTFRVSKLKKFIPATRWHRMPKNIPETKSLPKRISTLTIL